MKTNKLSLRVKFIIIIIVSVVLLSPFLIPRLSVIDSTGSKSKILRAEAYTIAYVSEIAPDYSGRIKGFKVSILDFTIIDTCPGEFDEFCRDNRHPLISALSYQLRVHSIMIWIWYVVSAIWLTIPKKIKLPDRNAVCRYADLYRIIKLKKPNPDKDGEFIEGKKIAICGITVRDDCPDEVFLGFPTYKKSRKMLEKDEGEAKEEKTDGGTPN